MIMSITVRMTMKSASVLHTKDAYKIHRNHNKGSAFDRCCDMTFKVKITQQDSDSETVDVDVV